MEDKNPRLGDERIGGRGDEYVTGRAGTPGDHTTSPGALRPGASSTESASYVSSPGSDVDTDQRTREIRKDIEQTREDLSETVNAIQDRLTPRNIASNAAESVRTAASETVRDFSDSEPIQYVRANPIPTAMVGIGIAGLAWLAFGGREARYSRRSAYDRNTRDWRVQPGSYEGEDYYRSTGPSYRSASAYSPGMSYPGATSQEHGTDLRSRATEVADDVSRRARQTTERTRSQLQRTWNDNPLLVGAASAVLGAIVGMAVPETRRENELMGEARDSMIEGVQQTVKEKVEDVQQAATSAVEKVQSAVGLVADNPGTETPGTTATARKRASRTTPGNSTPGNTDLGRS